MADCRNDLKSYALKSYTDTSKTLTYLGIAKDGRPLVGPYDSNGDLFDCKTLDQCGGIKVNNQYVYVFTNTFPYAIGCFGPGDVQKYQASCSANTCGNLGSSAVKIKFTYVFGMIAAILVSSFM